MTTETTAKTYEQAIAYLADGFCCFRGGEAHRSAAHFIAGLYGIDPEKVFADVDALLDGAAE